MAKSEQPLSGEPPSERSGRPGEAGRPRSEGEGERDRRALSGEPPSERSGRPGEAGRPRSEGEGERDPRALSDVKFLTVSEVASLMRVSKMTVYRLVHSGELPAIRVGRSFRVPEWAVHEYLRDSYIEAG